jgi:hypothetical protein
MLKVYSATADAFERSLWNYAVSQVGGWELRLKLHT